MSNHRITEGKPRLNHRGLCLAGARQMYGTCNLVFLGTGEREQWRARNVRNCENNNSVSLEAAPNHNSTPLLAYGFFMYFWGHLTTPLPHHHPRWKKTTRSCFEGVGWVVGAKADTLPDGFNYVKTQPETFLSEPCYTRTNHLGKKLGIANPRVGKICRNRKPAGWSSDQNICTSLMQPLKTERHPPLDPKCQGGVAVFRHPSDRLIPRLTLDRKGGPRAAAPPTHPTPNY